MVTNTRRVEVAGELYDVPVETYSRILTEAELTVTRRRFEDGCRLLVEDLGAVGDEAAERRLEGLWDAVFGHPYPVDLIRSHQHVLVALLDAQKAARDVEEARVRSRLRLPPRVS